MENFKRLEMRRLLNEDCTATLQDTVHENECLIKKEHFTFNNRLTSLEKFQT